MGSRKPSAKAKQVAAFKAELGGMDDIFAREERRREQRAAEHEEALREKACRSKNRYSCALKPKKPSVHTPTTARPACTATDAPSATAGTSPRSLSGNNTRAHPRCTPF